MSGDSCNGNTNYPTFRLPHWTVLSSTSTICIFERNGALLPGTIINLTVQLKTIVGEAIADGIITTYPFTGYEAVRPKARQKYLTAEELQRIMTTPLHRQTLYHVRDLFLFSCYTGIPYGDMRLLTKDNPHVRKTAHCGSGVPGRKPRWSLKYHCWTCRYRF